MALYGKTMRSDHSFCCVNVSDALYLIKQSIEENGVRVETRNGPALEFPNPCIITYNNQKERVLFYPERDANPIFHFMESMWMLDGRNDLYFIKYFNKQMEQYSNDKHTVSGAYGYRWRRYFARDQFETVIHRLRKYPNDRRTVLSMWDAVHDLRKDNESRDLPCNTHIYFYIRNNMLDMTVCNRSNDLIWGACGANAVHMSFLQEYIATMVGVEVGTYTQFSNNLHAYDFTLKKLEGMHFDYDSYASRNFTTLPPLIDDIKTFDNELTLWLQHRAVSKDWTNSIFANVAQPMLQTWNAWKDKDWKKAYANAERIGSDDWCVATLEWLNRRKDLFNG